VARALGADECVISGDFDPKIIETVRGVVARWGGRFACHYEENWRRFIAEWKKRGGVVVHLTMYGINLPDIIERIRKDWRSGVDILIIVGAEKVPREVYDMADYNVAIGNQPHSEVAALAIFLDWLFQGAELSKEFENAKYRIIPQQRGKKVIRLLR